MGLAEPIPQSTPAQSRNQARPPVLWIRGASSLMAIQTVPNRLRRCQRCRKPYDPYPRRKSVQRFCCEPCRVSAWKARQRPLPLNPPAEPLPPVRDQRVPGNDRSRLGKMSRAILERLREGPVTNRELAAMFPDGAAWRTRVSDVRFYLRDFGETVVSESLGCGRWRYRIWRL